MKIEKYHSSSENCYIIFARCRAFSDEGVKNNKLLVNANTGEILVWDNIANYYTSCYSVLSKSTAKKLLNKVRANF